MQTELLQQELARQTESAQEQVNFLQTLIDSIPISVYYKDREAKYLGCNKAFEQIVGRPKQEIIGKTARQIYTPELAERFCEQDRQLLDKGGLEYLEVDLQDQKGKTHHTILQKASFCNSSGHIAGVIGIGIDVSNLKNIENKLRESEEQLRSILDNLPVGVILIDRKQQVLLVNALIFKWFPNVMEDSANLLAGKIDNLSKKLDEEVKHGNEITEKLATANGERIFRTVISPVFDHDGGLSSFVKIFEDITKRLEIERGLHQAQKLESIGQLAAGIAHEINTPMQYVGDNLNFLTDVCVEMKALYDGYNKVYEQARQRMPEDKAVARLAEVIEEVDPEYLINEIPITVSQSLEGVQRVSKIVRAMRDFSHPGSEEKVHYDINHAIESTVIVSRNEWKYVANVEMELAPDLPQLLCFPGEMNQVFLNIIINAAHAIAEKVKEGGEKGTIKITTTEKNGCLLVTIADSGNGIPAEVRNRIFDPFFTTKEVGKGTGQGLAIAHNVVVEKHRGQLFFTTEENRGTTFCIKMPLS
jgi:PAS domain S-box-containing protein